MEFKDFANELNMSMMDLRKAAYKLYKRPQGGA